MSGWVNAARAVFVVRTVALPARLLEQWDQLAAAQLCQHAAELAAENAELRRRLRWADQLDDGSEGHSSRDDESVGAEGVSLRVLA